MGYFKLLPLNSSYLNSEQKQFAMTASTTLTAQHSGLSIHIGTDALVATLPAIGNVGYGIEYEFVNIGAAGAAIMTISPAAADGIYGTITLAATVVVMTGVANKDIINTKATSIKGDSVLLRSDSVGWRIVRSSGIFASE